MNLTRLFYFCTSQVTYKSFIAKHACIYMYTILSTPGFNQDQILSLTIFII